MLSTFKIIFLKYQDKGEEALSPDDDSATTTPKTVISSTHSPLPHISPTQSVGSDISIGAASEKDRPITPRMRTLSKGVRLLLICGYISLKN